MDFKTWLLLVESGRFDRDGFNALFRDQLAQLLPRVNDERRREPLSRAVGGTGVEAVPDRRRPHDDEVLAAFLTFLKAEVGDDAVKLLTVKMDDGLSQRDLIRHPAFKGLGEWRVRRLMARIRDAAVSFARRRGDEQILAAINRLTRTDEWCGGRAWVAA